MTRCLDEATLQSYFDGELSSQLMESATLHLAACASCAAMAREIEQETSILTAALTAEFEAGVPTERLRQRLDAAVLEQRLEAASAKEKAGLGAFISGLLNFGTQRTLGYAGLVMMMAFVAILGLVRMGTSVDTTATNKTQREEPKEVAISARVNQENAPVNESPAKETNNPESRRPVKPIKVAAGATPKQAPTPVKLLPGERAYLQTIARLDSTIESNKREMRPSLRVEYERNLAVVDRAIAATRTAAKSNPNDPDTADFMFAAYQSKVDLLNTIADARLGGGRSH